LPRHLNIGDAISIDEVGIRTGRHGAFHLKSAYQPIWRHRDGTLYPEAVEALARIFQGGIPVPPLDFFSSVATDQRFRVECVCRALHMHNFSMIDAPGLVMFFNYDPRVNGDLDQSITQLNYMAERIAHVGIDIRLLVCEITEADFLDRDTFVRLAAEIRRLGMRLAIDDFGAGHSTLARVQTVEPDVVKFDGSFFRRVVEEPGALRLLSKLVGGFQDGGALVVVEGIETADHMMAAIDTGADYLQGFLLGKPALAGTTFDTTPLAVDRFVRPTEGVYRLYAGSRR
jgi:EAL domain-containing protein (putative c-di-GMP-specific phosphodiesterase class I)